MSKSNLRLGLLWEDDRHSKTTIPTKQEAARTENHQNSRNKASWRPPSKPDWHTERREKKLRKIYKHKKEIREIILNSIMVEEEENHWSTNNEIE